VRFLVSQVAPSWKSFRSPGSQLPWCYPRVFPPGAGEGDHTESEIALENWRSSGQIDKSVRQLQLAAATAAHEPTASFCRMQQNHNFKQETQSIDKKETSVYIT